MANMGKMAVKLLPSFLLRNKTVRYRGRRDHRSAGCRDEGCPALYDCRRNACARDLQAVRCGDDRTPAAAAMVGLAGR